MIWKKTAFDKVYISEDIQSNASSSFRDSENLIDLEETETSSKNSPNVVPYRKSSKNKRFDNTEKSSIPVKNLKIYYSRYQEWVEAGTLPTTSSGRIPRPNPLLKNAPYACETGGTPTSRSNILNNVKEADLRFKEISSMPSINYFDASVPFRLPEEGEALDSWSGDTIALSFEIVRYVNPFPLPTIVFELCTFYEISPSQHSPQAWRLVAMAELMHKEIGIELDMFDLFGSYKLHEIR